MFPEFYGIATIPEIKMEEACGQHGWNITFRRGLNDWEMGRIADFFKGLKVFNGLTDHEDTNARVGATLSNLPILYF